ncbi:MAG: transglycosylase domain-containing protein, partial [Deltaproteobacteria bacterium]|nr:transglycosylase domain-containing protein [Deltaproteobacteria bacterium]
NRAPYGPALVGAAAASLAYFGKAPRTLSLAEAALLAGLPKAPTALDPRRHPRSARARRAHVLDRMRALELISRRAWRRALASPLALVAAPALNRDALHATDWARTQLQRRQSHGGVFRTTLDAPLLHDVAAIVRDHLASVGTRGATQAAVVVLDNRDGAVRALVGSAGYFTSPHGAVDGALARRQPGSALKPFTYALAFERGDTPATVIPDIETHYGDAKGRLFSPRNYTGDFSGPVLLDDALGRSLNVPAIRVAQRVGVKNLLRRLHRLGFASLTRSAQTYGLGLTLGNGEVTLVELAQAYATLARSGRACRARLFAKDPIPKDPPQVFSPQVAFLISHVLSDQRLRLEAFGPANALMFDFPVAVKTGTSTNFRDNWAIGSSGHVTVAVWVGDFEGRSLDHLSGAKGAGPLFARVLHRALGAERPDAPSPPKGVVATTICALSGKRAGPHCPHRREVYVPQSALPLPPCTWHRAIALDRRNGLRAGARCSSHHRVNRVYAVLPPAYAQWQARRDTLLPPTRYSPFCPADGPAQGALAIVNPKPKEVYLVEPGYDPKTQTLELRAQASHPVAHVVWRLDGRRIARATFPYSTRWPLNRGRHVLQVSAPGQRPDRVAFEVR